MRIAVHGKEFNRQSAPYITHAFEVLAQQGVDISVTDRFSKYLKSPVLKKIKYKTIGLGESLKGIDAFISIGGDGTLLEAVTHIGKTQIPVLGINAGRLGFLATNAKEEAGQAIMKVCAGDYTLDQRSALKVETNKDVFGKLNFALNDVTLVKKDTSSMITIHTSINGEFVNSYWADGIIVSTPTGSTGYSLSCGGPLIFPKSENFVITPVSPHNLTVRPIIVPDNVEIDFTVEGRSKKFLVSLDSRVAAVDYTIKLKVLKADFAVNLIQLEGQNYYKTLRQKLNWGLDIRN